VNATEIRTIAARLGIDELTVRRLQARGYLHTARTPLGRLTFIWDDGLRWSSA
jgi:hypothetical protein